MSQPVQHRSSLCLIGALALLSACGEVNPVMPPSVPTGAQTGVNSNASTAKSCQKNGWQGLVTSTGSSFASETACVSYGAQGGVLYRKQTITFTALAAKTFGDADFSVNATASSGLTVTFTASGNCTVTGATVHLTGAGSCTVTAHQAGDATWFAAADVVRQFAIAKGTQTVAFTSASPSLTLVGAPTYTPVAAASSGLSVAITLDAASTGCSLTDGVVSFIGAGVCVIDANQAGNGDWNPAAQQRQSITVYGCVSTEAQLRYVALVGGTYDFCAAAKVVLTGGEVVVGSTLSLTGVGGANAVIDANKTGRVLNVPGHLTLRDVTVTGGQTLGDGGGVALTTGGSLVLNGNSAIDGNAAYNAAGVWMQARTTMTMNDASTVSNNIANRIGSPGIATGQAGGVYVRFGSTLTMNGTSTVRKNSATGSDISGGGVLINEGAVVMNGSSAITENFTGQGGGVFFTNNGSLTLNASASITGNAATVDGGGIFRADLGGGTIAGVTATNVSGNAPNNCGGWTAVAGCVN